MGREKSKQDFLESWRKRTQSSERKINGAEKVLKVDFIRLYFKWLLGDRNQGIVFWDIFFIRFGQSNNNTLIQWSNIRMEEIECVTHEITSLNDISGWETLTEELRGNLNSWLNERRMKESNKIGSNPHLFRKKQKSYN